MTLQEIPCITPPTMIKMRVKREPKLYFWQKLEGPAATRQREAHLGRGAMPSHASVSLGQMLRLHIQLAQFSGGLPGQTVNEFAPLSLQIAGCKCRKAP